MKRPDADLKALYVAFGLGGARQTPEELPPDGLIMVDASPVFPGKSAGCIQTTLRHPLDDLQGSPLATTALREIATIRHHYEDALLHVTCPTDSTRPLL